MIDGKRRPLMDYSVRGVGRALYISKELAHAFGQPSSRALKHREILWEATQSEKHYHHEQFLRKLADIDQ